MENASIRPRYDIGKSYRWNYEHPPQTPPLAVANVPGSWNFCGLPAGSSLGVAAGPLLNGHWCLYYAGLGFDVLTYKTVRSRQRDCYALPNLQPVDVPMITDPPKVVPASDKMHGSWAVSFGMPSADPASWQQDIRWTREHLPKDKILSVSVVGSIQPDWTVMQLAEDYANCAEMAVASGADCIEINLSCPNVSTCDGQLYQNPQDAGTVAETVRRAIGDVPLVLKIGYMTRPEAVAGLLEHIAGANVALAMTNSIAAKVCRGSQLLFDGQQRGICGQATREQSLQQVERFSSAIARQGLSIPIVGVGGIGTAGDVRRYLDVGAHACHLATAVMTNPGVGIEIRNQLESSSNTKG